MPVTVSMGTRRAEIFMETHRLYAMPVAKFPLQIFTGNKFAKSWMKGFDMVVLKINLDKCFPVVIAFMHFDMIE